MENPPARCARIAFASPAPSHTRWRWLHAAIVATLMPWAAHAQQDVVDAARAAARADRNAEAADLFARAIAAEPQRRRELLAEYADQLTYAGRAAQAVPLYRELLASPPASEDERLRLLKGLGLALLWSDQPTEARAAYEEVVRIRPGDLDARRNLARAMSWGNRQREAVATLQQILHEHPGDAEARVQLAQAQAWMGRTDLARATLQQGGLPDRDDARRLLANIERWQAHRTRLEAQRSNQSDGLDIDGWRLEHEAPVHQGRGMVGLRLDRLDFEREDGTDGARVTRPMLLGRWRFGDAFELNAQGGPERIAPRGTPAMDRFVYATWLTWWPDDRFRFDLSTSRSTFDNLQSLRMGLTARLHGLSMDFTPDERQRYTLRLERGDYSDGNRRRQLQLEGEWRVLPKPQLWLGLRHHRFDFSQLLNHGYFNPREFELSQATARAAWRPGGDEGRWEFSAALAWGREHADPGGSKPAYDASLRAAWLPDARTRLEARAQRFSSRTGAFSGFARTTYGLQLERGW